MFIAFWHCCGSGDDSGGGGLVSFAEAKVGQNGGMAEWQNGIYINSLPGP